jgi:uncharacterized protein CbrC (UPF0167 family)
MDNNQFHHSKVPFFLEVEFYDKVNSEAEDALLRSLFKNEDILPGLRVNKMFANCVDKDVLIADELQNDLKHLQEEFEKFKNKYINFADDRSKDICMNKLGMEPKDFSTQEQDHAAEIKEVTKDNNQWHQAKVPFFLEVEYYDEYNPDTESKIMKSLLRNEDILPGLRVNQMFANCVDKNVLIADEIKNDLRHLQEEFEKFKNKYINFADDRSKDICMNKLGMEPNDFSDMEKGHAAYIKEVTKDNKIPLIDSNTGRYKAYDDPTNFPA